MADRARSSPCKADRAEVGVRERRGVREHMCESQRFEAGHRIPEGGDEPAGERGRAFHRDLLAEDRANADLERIDGARHAQSGPRFDERFQRRVAAEGRVDRDGVGVEIASFSGAWPN